MAAVTNIDIVLSFDTTGSMAPCLYQVRQVLSRLTDLIFTSIPLRGVSARVGVICHGDYDSVSQYIVKKLELTNNIDSIKHFILNTEAVRNSWNEGEAYEVALREANAMAWNPSARKVIILVGDDKPHPANFPGNTLQLDWKQELQSLTDMDIAIYAVQCPSLKIERSQSFYQALSQSHARSTYILLSQFSMIGELLIALLYHASDDTTELEAYETQLRKTGTYNRNMEQMFNTLLAREDRNTTNFTTHTFAANANIQNCVPVPIGRFQRFSVNRDVSIKDFVLETGAVFKTGRGFYELSKTETINSKKEVILEHLQSGNMYSGEEARRILGLPSNSTAKINRRDIPSDYRVFVQSTSYNRKLIANTSFLYEITQS